MSSLELKHVVIRLMSAQAVISYPPVLSPWFDGLPAAAQLTSAKRFSLLAGTAADRFRVATDGEAATADLGLADALAMLWERVTRHLVEDLADALVLHAAALDHPAGQVLLPGASGAGKTHLALWYRAQGYELRTDEVVAVSLASKGSREALVTSALPRPIILKDLAHAGTWLRPEDQISATQGLAGATLIATHQGDRHSTQRRYDRTLVVFPRYEAGAPLALTALTAAQTGLRLLGNCINSRNLPHGGLPLASAAARQVIAIELIYGSTAQLENCLDVLTRQVLAAGPRRDDLTALCTAFTAKAAMRRSAIVSLPREATTWRPSIAPSASTAAHKPFRLTVGMATYDDYDGVYFTIQSIRTYHPELHDALEFVVIDNNPQGPCSQALSDLGRSIPGYRYIPHGDWSGTAIRNLIFEAASSEFVLCVDSHVLVVAGALSKLLAHLEGNAGDRDLIQGPLLYDDLQQISTHMEPTWRGGMYGVWASDPRGADPQASPFEVPMQGLGLFACRRTAWVGFNPAFRGFGGEEGYIHEKMRRRGGRTICLPGLRWLHRFGRPLGARYQNRWEDRIRNYLIGFTELGLDTAAMEDHFDALLGVNAAGRLFGQTRLELGLVRAPR